MAYKITTEEFIKRAQHIHQNTDGSPKYDYSKSVYIKSTVKTEIICPQHGSFYQIPSNHLVGQGCPKCGNIRKQKALTKTTEEFIKQAQQVNQNSDGSPKYDYSKSVYTGKSKNLIVTCPIHGDFLVRPDNHINFKSGCPKCYRDKQTGSITKTTEEFIKQAQQVHQNPDGSPKYIYDKTEYFRSKDYVDIECPIHGVFTQIPNAHLSGQGCPECGRLSQINKRSKSEFDFIKQAQQIHQNLDGTPKYLYNKTNYTMCHDHVIITCPIHGDFEQRPYKHLQGHCCPKCRSNSISNEEKEIYKLLDENNIKYKTNDRSILKPQELDIYIPSLNTGIEFDGIYWHSNKFKPNNYHLQKTLAAENKGIQLIHIFESEWLNTSEIVKARLLNLLGKNKWFIGARKCKIKQVSVKEERTFLENNHLQGYVASTVCYGLYYFNVKNQKEYLVALMSFGESRFDKNIEWELLRFCNVKNFNIVGGASKLFKHFINTFNPESVISYADRRWSTTLKPNLYDKLGFKLDSISQPGYFYVNGLKLENRSKYTKEKCKKLGCSENMSEKEFVTRILGLNIIYDVGQLKYIWK